MTRIRPQQLEFDFGQPLERLKTRAKKHDKKLDKMLSKLVEEQQEKIDHLSQTNLRLSKIVSKFSHFLSKEKLEELRRDVDSADDY